MEKIEDLILSYIDIIATEYHWSKNDILDLYPAEINDYVKKIQVRQIDDIIVKLQIAQNPHVKNPETLFKQLELAKNRLNPVIFGDENDDRDPNATEKIKSILGGLKFKQE